jgi:hypothetical protein
VIGLPRIGAGGHWPSCRTGCASAGPLCRGDISGRTWVAKTSAAHACQASSASIRLVPQASNQPTPSTAPVAFQFAGDPCWVIPRASIFGGVMLGCPPPTGERAVFGRDVGKEPVASVARERHTKSVTVTDFNDVSWSNLVIVDSVG